MIRQEALLTREWLVTNALGGYASGTIGGAYTRRFHGFLIAALPAPLGRTMMFNHLEEVLEGPDGLCWRLSGDEHGGREVALPEDGILEEFAIENGRPVWRFSGDGIRIEKRVLMPHLQNTTYIVYRLLEGPEPDCGCAFARRCISVRTKGWLRAAGFDQLEGDDRRGRPRHRDLRRRRVSAAAPARLRQRERIEQDPRSFEHVLYRIEKSRGYEHEGELWSPGVIHIDLTPGHDCGLVASVESWDVVKALPCADAVVRRRRARREDADDLASDRSLRMRSSFSPPTSS